MIVFSCPTCHKAMQVPPTMAGQTVACPFCHNGVIVPPIPPPAPLPPSPPQEVLSLDDPEEEARAAEAEAEEEAERERRVRARYAAAEAKQRRTANICMMLGPVLGLLGAACLAVLWPMISRDINGAKPIDAAGLANFDEAKRGSPWVLYDAKEVIGTDVGIETKRRRGSTQTVFVVVPVQDKYLIVQRGVGDSGKKLEGRIVTFNSGLEKEAVDKVQAKHPDKKGKWLPHHMDATGGGAAFGPIAVLIVAGGMILFGLGCALYGFVSRPKARPHRRRYS